MTLQPTSQQTTSQQTIPTRPAVATRRISIATVSALLAMALSVALPDGASAGDDLPQRLLTPERVELIDSEQFQAVLASHKGKVVLVNLWATWCVPCVQELPELDVLQKRLRDRGLVVLAVSMDKPEILEERVRPFFAEKAPNLVSYLQNEKDEFDFVSTLDPEWLGGLPTSFFIGRDGKVSESFIGRLTYQDVEKRVLRLLDQKP